MSHPFSDRVVSKFRNIIYLFQCIKMNRNRDSPKLAVNLKYLLTKNNTFFEGSEGEDGIPVQLDSGNPVHGSDDRQGDPMPALSSSSNPLRR